MPLADRIRDLGGRRRVPADQPRRPRAARAGAGQAGAGRGAARGEPHGGGGAQGAASHADGGGARADSGVWRRAVRRLPAPLLRRRRPGRGPLRRARARRVRIRHRARKNRLPQARHGTILAPLLIYILLLISNPSISLMLFDPSTNFPLV